PVQVSVTSQHQSQRSVVPSEQCFLIVVVAGQHQVGMAVVVNIIHDDIVDGGNLRDVGQVHHLEPLAPLVDKDHRLELLRSGHKRAVKLVFGEHLAERRGGILREGFKASFYFGHLVDQHQSVVNDETLFVEFIVVGDNGIYRSVVVKILRYNPHGVIY